MIRLLRDHGMPTLGFGDDMLLTCVSLNFFDYSR